MPKKPSVLKRYLISSAITFVSGFSIAFGMALSSSELITTDVLISILVGASMAGLRAVLKYLNEKFVI